jgi:hypothetical protein
MATAAPIPLEEPVTMATLPSSVCGFDMSGWHKPRRREDAVVLKSVSSTKRRAERASQWVKYDRYHKPCLIDEVSQHPSSACSVMHTGVGT